MEGRHGYCFAPGTGAAYGEEDYVLSRENGFPFGESPCHRRKRHSTKKVNGSGENVWDANKPIAKDSACAGRGLEDRTTGIQHELSALLPLWHAPDVSGTPELVHGYRRHKA